MTKKTKHNNSKRFQKIQLLMVTAVLLMFTGIITSLSNPVVSVEEDHKQLNTSVSKNAGKSSEKKTVLSTYQEIMKLRITLRFDDQTEVIDKKLLSDWFSEETDQKGNLVCKTNDAAMKSYVHQLAEKYNTYKDYITFVTTYGESVDLTNNSVGWILDEEYCLSTLKKLISDRESVNLNLTDESESSNKWWLRIAAKYAQGKSYGNTYVEVSIDNQYLWLYMDGEVVLESPVVTGMPEDNRDTPKGAFVVGYKQKEANLYDTDYLIRVHNWISFYNDVGFHDAEWQESFGGDVYIYNGSHGCVNMPLDAVERLYDLTYENMPVFVY